MYLYFGHPVLEKAEKSNGNRDEASGLQCIIEKEWRDTFWRSNRERKKSKEDKRRNSGEERGAEEGRTEEDMETQTVAQVSSSSILVASTSSSSVIEPGNHEQEMTDVYVPRACYVVSMNTRDFSSIVAL